jgi:hypothetical protein
MGDGQKDKTQNTKGLFPLPITYYLPPKVDKPGGRW